MRALPALLLTTLAPAPAAGQDAPEPGPPEPPPAAGRGISYELTLSPSVSLEASFGNADAEMGVTRVGGWFSAHLPIGQADRLTFNAGSEHSWYEFDGPTMLAPGTSEPFEHVGAYEVGLLYTSRVNERWTWMAGASVESWGEDGADFGETLTYAGFAGVQWRAAEGLRMGVLLSVSSRLEDDVRVLPLPLIEWQIDERWRLGPWPLDGSAGAYALTYSPSQAWTLGVAGAYRSREFRLDEDGPVPDGVGRDRRVPVAFVAQWAPDERWVVRGFAGADVYAEVEVLDATGDSLGEDETDPAFTFGLSATLRF